MIRSGLVSITFRKQSIDEVIALAVKNGLAGIEWGGDVHCPHGDTARAAEVGRMTRDAGLAVAAYGAYYRVVESETQGLPFEKVVDSAVALETKIVRIWAGRVTDSLSATPDDWRRVIEETKRLADLAKPAGLILSFEFHSGTLNDRVASTQRLLSEIDRPNVNTLWQPTLCKPANENLEDLRILLPWVSNLHVFHWINGAERRPLAEGEADWKAYLEAAHAAPIDRFALLEFVKDESVDQFEEDAAVLNRLLAARP